MRVVIQRVCEASVTVNDQLKGAIGKGLLVLFGVEQGDDAGDLQWLVQKIVNLRVFDDAQGVMNLSVKDVNAQVLVVSQFTLHASTKKGNRPSYIRSANPVTAIPIYEFFINNLEKDLGKPVMTGEFGADMKVALINDGPVTILIDTKNKE
ncbi:MAG: D-tyrosyl-tRNA(Tyr) deacylase [Bacteroidetes bacterium]|nr:D-tyrosyl-tRNA(Tyr) deacylase [Bacteroidota bacterium]HET6243875.1 D-aminoacyl-tRNA deacylase [Bacteroidia bacterium]